MSTEHGIGPASSAMASAALWVREHRLEAGRRIRGLRFLTARTLGLAQVGARPRVGRGVLLHVAGRLELGSNAHFDDGSSLHVAAGATVRIGDDFYLGRGSVIAAVESISIGSGCLVGEHASIRDSDHLVEREARRAERAGLRRPLCAPVVIGDDVWVGAGVRVLRGSRIGDGAVLAANAVVRGAVAADTVVGGVPARLLSSGGSADDAS